MQEVINEWGEENVAFGQILNLNKCNFSECPVIDIAEKLAQSILTRDFGSLEDYVSKQIETMINTMDEPLPELG
jgi:hypothetical protein